KGDDRDQGQGQRHETCVDNSMHAFPPGNDFHHPTPLHALWVVLIGSLAQTVRIAKQTRARGSVEPARANVALHRYLPTHLVEMHGKTPLCYNRSQLENLRP